MILLLPGTRKIIRIGSIFQKFRFKQEICGQFVWILRIFYSMAPQTGLFLKVSNV